MLHLAGYDHERDRGKMASTEERLRKFLHLPASLININREPQGNGRQGKTSKAALGRKIPTTKAAGKSRSKEAR
jgi:hypothetical protein